MTIIEALNEICEKQIPKEINGVRTKFIIHERKISDYPEASELLVTILPKDVRKDNIGTTRNYRDMYYITYDFERATLGYKHLERDIEELLCLYIRNIISYFQGDGKAWNRRAENDNHCNAKSHEYELTEKLESLEHDLNNQITLIGYMEEREKEYKRLLKAAISDIYEVCSCNTWGCGICEHKRETCDYDDRFTWKHKTEALKLIGEEDENS